MDLRNDAAPEQDLCKCSSAADGAIVGSTSNGSNWEDHCASKIFVALTLLKILYFQERQLVTSLGTFSTLGPQ